MTNLDLSGQTVIVTGTSGNLGPIWVEALEDVGATVFSFDLPDLDVIDPDQPRQFAWKFQPDILINNAGIDSPPETKSTFFGNWDEILAVNLTGAKNMIEAVLPGMIKRGHGQIINIGSMYGLVSPDKRNYPDGFEKPAAYGASKAGLMHLTRLVAAQYGQYGIRINNLVIGAVESESHRPKFKEKMTSAIPMGRMANKEDLKKALWGILASDYANGVNFLHDGGYTCL